MYRLAKDYNKVGDPLRASNRQSICNYVPT
jgi:hypothetical protein